MTKYCLELATFLLFVGVSGLRFPSLLRGPRGAPSWYATFFGAVGLLSVGVVIPLSTIDGWLGGTNVANLLQDECAVLAFWFFRNAVLDYTQDGQKRYPRWLLAIMLFATGFPFFLIQHRGATSPYFGVDHISQLADLAYEDLYFACLIFICSGMIYSIRSSKSPLIRAIVVGLALMGLGSLSDSTFMTMSHFHVTNAVLLPITFQLFYLLFYPGALTVVAALGAIMVVERQYAQRFLWLRRIRRLRKIGSRLQAQAQASPNVVIRAADSSQFPVDQAYQLVITLHNLEAKLGRAVSPRDRQIIGRVEGQLVRALPAGVRLPDSLSVEVSN
jgi:hypothetical protein